MNVQVRLFSKILHCALFILFQLINTPNLRIVDYGVGMPGSQHDSTAWEETKIPKDREGLLEGEEFVWADTAYALQTWCQSPYKK
jgi:hypothetical protein